MFKRTRILGLFLASLVCLPALRAQQKQLRAVPLQTPARDKAKLSKSLRHWTLYQLDDIGAKTQENLRELHIQLGQRTLRFEGKQQPLPKQTGIITERGPGYTRTHAFPELVHFNGPGLRMTLGKNFILGEYTDGGKKFIVEQLSHFSPGASSGSVVVYAATDIIETGPASCAGAQLAPGAGERIPQALQRESVSQTQGTCRMVDVSVMVNSTSFKEHQSSISETAAYIVSIYNLAEGDYIAAFSDEFRFRITELVISTAPETDPWVHTDDIYRNLENFWYFAGTGFSSPNDLSSYWFRTQNFNGGVIGLAYTGFTCNDVGDAAIREFGGSAQTMRTLLSHEIGHNFNMAHDAAGAPFIMAPSINGSKTFSASSKTSFENFVSSNAASCITQCGENTCDETLVNGFNLTADQTNQSIKVQWNETAGSLGYHLRWWEKGSSSSSSIQVAAGQTTFSIPLSCSNTYLYRVEIANICASGQTGTFTGVEFANTLVPQITLEGPDLICGTSTTELRSSLNTGNQWYRDGQAIDGATGSLYTVSQPGVYTVKGTGAAGCTYTSNELFIVQNLGVERPKIIAEGSTRLCAGEQVGISAPEAKRYEWLLNGLLISGENSRTIRAGQNGYYAVRTTSAEGCILVSDSILVEVKALPAIPEITLNRGTTLCPGESITFASTGNYSFVWLKDGVAVPGANARQFTTDQVGSYQLRITDELGCSSSSGIISLQMGTLPEKPLIIAPANRSICSGDTLNLSVNAAGQLQWMKDLQPIEGANQPAYRANTSGDYVVQVTNASGCSAISDPVPVIVNALPTVPAIVAASSTSFCQGGTVLLQTSTTGTNLQWLRNGAVIQGAVGPQLEVTQTGSYTLASTNASGCNRVSASIAVTVQANPATPAISTGGSTAFCAGNQVVLSTSAASGYQWFRNGTAIPNATTQNFPAKEAGNYTLVVANGSGCISESSSPVSITVHPNPAKPPLNWNGTEFSTLAGFKTYQWLKDGTQIAGASGNTYRPSSAGNYQTSVTDNNNCPAISETYPLVVTGLQNVTIAGTTITSFPNPSRGTLFLRVVGANPPQNLVAQVVDLNGRYLQKKNLVLGNNSFELGGLPTGMYVMMISDGKEKQMIKFVLSR